jgi:hypothetical protein
MAEHGHERHEPGSASDQKERPAVVDVPGEVTADRASQLQRVTDSELVGQVGRDLALVDALDGDGESAVFWRRGDGVGALGLVAVPGRQADVDVHAGQVARPVGDLDHDGRGLGGLLVALSDGPLPPQEGTSLGCQSPQ